jgi:hypothetical protein
MKQPCVYKVNIGNSMCTKVTHVAYKARSLQWEAFPVMMMKSLVEHSCQSPPSASSLFCVVLNALQKRAGGVYVGVYPQQAAKYQMCIELY